MFESLLPLLTMLPDNPSISGWGVRKFHFSWISWKCAMYIIWEQVLPILGGTWFPSSAATHSCNLSLVIVGLWYKLCRVHLDSCVQLLLHCSCHLEPSLITCLCLWGCLITLSYSHLYPFLIPVFYFYKFSVYKFGLYSFMKYDCKFIFTKPTLVSWQVRDGLQGASD